MSIAATSIEAYRKIERSGAEISQMGRVALYVARVPGCTRVMISRGTGLPEARVAARVNKLVNEGVLMEQGLIMDSFTHCASKRLWIAEGENFKLAL